MTEQEQREWAIEIAKSHLGVWYRWGGDDPSGFDCSGFVIEVLKSIGKLPRMGDWTAHAMAHMAHSWMKTWKKIPGPPQPGDLVFWYSASDKNHVIHVEMAVNRELSIGASGGNSRTVNSEMAIYQNAFIKIRPIITRPNIWGYVDPFC